METNTFFCHADLMKKKPAKKIKLEQPDFQTENQMSPRAPLQVLAYC